MITWVVKREQLNENFSLFELEEFSKKHNAKIIIKDLCEIKNGELTSVNKNIMKKILQ